MVDIDWKFWAILVVNIAGLGFMAWQVSIMKKQIAALPSTRSTRRVAAERQLTKRMYVPVVLMALLVLLSWLPYVFQKSQPDVFPTILAQWGGDTSRCDAIVETASFADAAAKYRVFDVCHVKDSSVDELEDTKIAISAPFNITGGPVNITVIFTPGSPITNVAKPGSFMGHTIVLLPKDDDGSAIRKLSDVSKHGGIIIAVGAKRPKF